MIDTRVIPCLLLKAKGFVKTERFKNPIYLGDPINILKIFNEKEAHEIIILDIDATISDRAPKYSYLSEIASECFMPLGYGGGIKNIESIKQILSIGFEKVVLNTVAHEHSEIVRKAANMFGSQSIVVSIDAKKSFIGKYEVYVKGGKQKIKRSLIEYAQQMESMGAGEILINSIDLDGTMLGYDIPLIEAVSSAVSVPVLACGGAGCLQDFSSAIKIGGASAAVAGSLFVFHGKHKAVLISFPEDKDLRKHLDY